MLAEAMADAGAAAVSLEDPADQPIYEPPPGETPLWRHVRVVGLFAADVDIDALAGSLQAAMPAALPAPVVEPLVDKDWVREGQKGFAPTCFGDRLWICPSWETCPDPTAPVVLLDPGLAFGTGTHPTTALCLEWIARSAAMTGKKVADYGCGSGILAVAALRMGADRVCAIDNDPQALQATRDNAVRNEVGDRIETMLPNAVGEREFDVVLANILSGTLIELAPTLPRYLARGGHLVLSGVLTDQADAVMRAYADAITWHGEEERDGWVSLSGTKE